jgi:hypothetical protein
LPKIKEVLPDQDVEPTVMKTTLFGEKQEQMSLKLICLSVTEGGELIINNDIDGRTKLDYWPIVIKEVPSVSIGMAQLF